MSGTEAVIVTGALARRPRAGDHACVFLYYLLGFRRLGYEVVFIDRIEGDGEAGAAMLRSLLELWGVEWSLLAGDRVHGLSHEETLALARRGSLLLNVMGYLDDDEILGASSQRVFLDIDPGFGQMWRELGLADVFADHDAYATIGENVGHIETVMARMPMEDWSAIQHPQSMLGDN